VVAAFAPGEEQAGEHVMMHMFLSNVYTQIAMFVIVGIIVILTLNAFWSMLTDPDFWAIPFRWLKRYFMYESGSGRHGIGCPQVPADWMPSGV
jgi:hypothetical protein